MIVFRAGVSRVEVVVSFTAVGRDDASVDPELDAAVCAVAVTNDVLLSGTVGTLDVVVLNTPENRLNMVVGTDLRFAVR